MLRKTAKYAKCGAAFAVSGLIIFTFGSAKRKKEHNAEHDFKIKENYCTFAGEIMLRKAVKYAKCGAKFSADKRKMETICSAKPLNVQNAEPQLMIDCFPEKIFGRIPAP